MLHGFSFTTETPWIVSLLAALSKIATCGRMPFADRCFARVLCRIMLPALTFYVATAAAFSPAAQMGVSRVSAQQPTVEMFTGGVKSKPKTSADKKKGLLGAGKAASAKATGKRGISTKRSASTVRDINRTAPSRHSRPSHKPLSAHLEASIPPLLFFERPINPSSSPPCLALI